MTTRWVTWWGNKHDAHAVHFEPKARFDFPDPDVEYKGLTKCGKDIEPRKAYTASPACIRCSQCVRQLECENGSRK